MVEGQAESDWVITINNIVDITNFVLHESGQPLHAFDADEVTGAKSDCENTRGRHEIHYGSITKERILLCKWFDDLQYKRNQCVLQVFSVESNLVFQLKRKISFWRASVFSSTYVRRTGMLHQLKTDASFRFWARHGSKHHRVCLENVQHLLIKEIAVDQISSEIIDVYPNKYWKSNDRSQIQKYWSIDRKADSSQWDVFYSRSTRYKIFQQKRGWVHSISATVPCLMWHKKLM